MTLHRFEQERYRSLEVREKELEERLAEKNRQLEAEIAAKRAEMDTREKELEERRKVLNDRDSKHTRRQIFKDIKEKLEDRSATFELTKGTRRLRWFPIRGDHRC